MIGQRAYPLLITGLIISGPLPVAAQDEGGSMLERFLQDTLSGDDQNVTVKGLQGALSARATIEEITVADDEGVWLTIKDAQLDWNRLALIRGRFSVNALTAQEIDIARAPGTTTKEEAPASAETQPFQLPELPVAIEIGEIRVDDLSLGEPLIGVAADLSVTGNLSLADGTLDTNLDVIRLDRAGDEIKLAAGFQNSTSEINLDLQVTEASGGLISTALKIPDSPPVGLTAKGAGPLTDFTADIGLSSNNQMRVTGQVRLQAAEGGAADGIAFTTDLNGDLTPFLGPDIDPFFGPKSRLYVDGQTKPEGALDISDLELTTQALDLKGELQLGEGSELQLAALQGRITPPDGQTVVLPVAGGDTSIKSAQLSALFDRQNGNLWDLSLTANEFASPQAKLGDARITAQGTLDQGEVLTVDGDVQATVSGIDMADPALNSALGERITLDGQFDYSSDQSVRLSDFELVGTDYTLALDALIDGLTSGLTVDGSASLDATDLARFSDLAKLDLGGQVSARVEGKGSPLERSFDGKVVVQGRDLSTGRDDIDPVITGETTITLDGSRGTDGITIREFDLVSEAANAVASGFVTTPDGNLTIDGQARVNASDLSVFSGLAKRELGGALQATVDGKGTVQTLEFDGTATVIGQNIKTGMTDIDPLLTGRTEIEWDGVRTTDSIDIRNATVNGKALSAQVQATIEDPTGDLSADGQARLNVPDLSLFSGLAGRDLFGSVAVNVQGSGTLSSRVFDVQGNLDANDIQTGIDIVDKLIQGETTLTVDAENGEQGLDIQNFRLNGTAIAATASGKVNRESGGLDYSVKLDDLARILNTMSGPLTLDGNVAPTSSGIEGTANLNGPDSSYAKLVGTVDSDGSADLDFDAKFNRIERFVPEFPGTIAANGSAKRNKGVWTIDAKAEGPAQINSDVSGTFDENTGEADLKAVGGVNLGIANIFITPNKIDGNARYDLSLSGKPALESLSGSITTSGTSLAIPAAGQTITGISGSVELAQSRATVSLSGGPRAGGNFTVSGPIDLTPPFNANVTTALNSVVLTDKLLFETTLNGQIAMTGALAGNSSIAGQITFDETNINLAAAAGAVGAAPIPDIIHVNESRASYVTRERAGLVEEEGAEKSASRIALDVSLLAPKAVFVRGRGVNAELGGRIHIGGTTSSVIPSGQIELIRGNFDILGRRLALTKGLVTLQGDLTPYIEFESSTSTSDGTATIEIAGPLDAPEVDVFSDPERPAEEALAMLLFGNRFSELSPFVIAQMAASLAQLSGAGGDATKGLRESTGLDTVDIGATEGGAGRLGAGAYLSDNLYTDFTVNTEGDTEVNLNLDVTDNFTVKGTVDGRGETGVGVFFSRDY
ncbi:translocation/assembly module TamB domain-containing protein [Ruegeria sp. Ofav3-42]|uniref:translocation/assembly module TamB domain-containing protein n=1 Tax=Ruegeria sp. Ofav3-42 TaxID=2917759 RepID=UPI001EF3E1F2|nr:translocation/assembly module TamB domain-containing protein [Ruegeria sp. Ofav3-42]MCG7518663.1 translocation/assembly module TamB domain-containing protein [Ruegeria sp. Ofav3-42]